MIVKFATLDGNVMSEHGRTFSMSREERGTPITLGNGDLKRYVKSIKKVFSFKWTWLPNDSTQTVDGRMGQQRLSELVTLPASIHQLDLYNHISDTTESYFVKIESYKETLLRRDYTLKLFFYDIELELKEI